MSRVLLGRYLGPLDFTGRTSGFVGGEPGVRNLSARYIFQCVDRAFAVFDKRGIGTTQALQFAARYWVIGAIDKQRLEFVPEAVRSRMRHENMDRNIRPEEPQAAGCTFEEILGRQRHHSEAASRYMAGLAKYLVDDIQASCGQEAQRDQVTLHLDGDGKSLLLFAACVQPQIEPVLDPGAKSESEEGEEAGHDDLPEAPIFQKRDRFGHGTQSDSRNHGGQAGAACEIEAGPMKPINPRKFRKQIEPYNMACPFCREKIEMYCSGRCPACGDTGRIEPIKSYNRILCTALD